eukprot:SAG11_NODE_1575_length_4659_cov_2.048904_8_plen_72_part_00
MCVGEGDRSRKTAWKLVACGTGIGTLIPTCPTATSCWNFRAVAPYASRRTAHGILKGGISCASHSQRPCTI